MEYMEAKMQDYYDQYDRAEADTSRGWQTIDSAPKMKQILLFAVTDVDVAGAVKNWKMATGFWNSGYADHRDMTPWEWSGRQLAKYDIQPTHWQPLPAPPTTSGEEGGR